MNPLILFDYFFYRVTFLYKKVGYDEISGIMVLVLIQIINILDISNLFPQIKNFVADFYVYLFIISSILLFALNYIRYKRIVTYEELQQKWDNENVNTKRIKDVLAVIYIILSIYFIAPHK